MCSELVEHDIRERDRPVARLRLRWCEFRCEFRQENELLGDLKSPAEEVDVFKSEAERFSLT